MPQPVPLSQISKLIRKDTGASFCLYSLPGGRNVELIAGVAVPFEGSSGLSEGFLFRTFAPDGQVYCINPSIKAPVIRVTERQVHLPLYYHNGKQVSSSQAHYEQCVQEALQAFEAGSLEKVVLSRPQVRPLPEGFSPLPFFLELVEKYPEAFVYLLSSPECGTWAGATPELLLRAGAGAVETMALAGTSATGKENFKDKERNEQALVTDYIQKVLQEYCGEVQVHSPDTTRAGTLTHIVTFLNGKLRSQADWFELAEALHPTPAVGGLPFEEALMFIRQHEGYDRELYSGYLGPVWRGNKARLYVNLRCMQLKEKEAVFYAGAGIVPGSVPEKEWEETGYKMDTLRKVMQNR